MLEGLVEIGVVAQLADHGDGVLSGQEYAGINTAENPAHKGISFYVQHCYH